MDWNRVGERLLVVCMSLTLLLGFCMVGYGFPLIMKRVVCSTITAGVVERFMVEVIFRSFVSMMAVGSMLKTPVV